MMVYKDHKDRESNTPVNISEPWKMIPTILTVFDRYELDDSSDYSYDDIYHSVDSSDNYMDISIGDADNIIQEPSRPRVVLAVDENIISVSTG